MYGDRFCGGNVLLLPEECILTLSVLLRTVCSRMSKVWARASRCNIPPTNSRSEVGYGAGGVLGGDQFVNDMLGPL